MKQIMEQLKIPFLTILSIFILFYVFAKLFGTIPLSINSVTTTDLFTVQGEGEATAIPNTAHINLGVTKTAETVLKAQQQTNEAVSKIIADLKKLGIEDKNIKTTNYSVNPNYDFSKKREEISGYTVTENLEVKIKPIDKANKVLDLATEDGANLVGGINFVLDDKTQKELEEKSRRDAINNAREKAKSISQAANIRLGRIVSVYESPFPIFEPKIALDKEQYVVGGRGGEPSQLPPGQNTVRITITLNYETL